jgi:plastocyanin
MKTTGRSGLVATTSSGRRFRSRFSRGLPALGAGIALCILLGRPNPAGAQSAATGSIQGVVEISSTLAARRPRFRIYADPGTGSLPPAGPKDPIAAELRNVVIYLEGDSLRNAKGAPATRASMAQRDERFVPHVLPILVGTTVDFPNDDDVYHNVFSLSSAAAPGDKGFDLGRYPKGSSKSWTFDRRGTVQVLCHIHSDMSAFVLVLPNPFYAVPDDDHRFVIDGVPEGDYTIIGWHERAKIVTHRVHVAAGKTSMVDFNIPLPPAGKQSP